MLISYKKDNIIKKEWETQVSKEAETLKKEPIH